MESSEISSIDVDGRVKTVMCDWSTTFASAAFQSPSRLRLAWEHRLRLTGYGLEQLKYIAGLYADGPTLHLAEELGWELNHSTVKGVTCSACVSAMEYLTKAQHRPMDRIVAEHAAKTGNIDVLKKNSELYVSYQHCH
jgi:hypothetical protein